MTIESKTSKTILEEPTEYTIQGVAIKAAPPSTATLIKISELVSKMPSVNSNVEQIVYEVLRVARDCRIVGKIAAYLLLGVTGVQVVSERSFFGLFSYKKKITADELADMLLQEPPSVLSQIIVERLNSMEVADFFGITTSLAEVNILRQTKRKAEEVV